MPPRPASRKSRSRSHSLLRFMVVSLTTTVLITTGGLGTFPNNPLTQTFQQVLSQNLPAELLQPANAALEQLAAPTLELPPAPPPARGLDLVALVQNAVNPAPTGSGNVAPDPTQAAAVTAPAATIVSTTLETVLSTPPISATATLLATATGTITSLPTETTTATPTATQTPTPTPTSTPSSTGTQTPSLTPTVTATRTPTLFWPTATRTRTLTPRPTLTPTPTSTATSTATPIPTDTPTSTPTSTETPVPTDTPAPLAYNCTNPPGATGGYGCAISSVLLNGSSNTSQVVAPGSLVTFAFNYQVWSDPSCPGCIMQVVPGLGGTAHGSCAYNGGPGAYPGASGGPSSFDFTAPSANGQYFFYVHFGIEYNCPNAVALYYAGGTVFADITVSGVQASQPTFREYFQTILQILGWR